MSEHVHTIAQKYNSQDYTTAADNFRIPFWDWAIIPTAPDITGTATVHINTPSGPKDVDNPLYSYKFQNFPLNSTWFPSDQDNKLSTYNETKRCPDDNGVSNMGAVNSALGASNLRAGAVIYSSANTLSSIFANNFLFSS
jgi:tyrosinase